MAGYQAGVGASVAQPATRAGPATASPELFLAFAQYVQREAGIVLSAEKRYLVDARIEPIIRREGLSGLAHLVSILERRAYPRLAAEVIEAVTVNETYFFRDKVVFDVLAQGVLPGLIEARAGKRHLRIWSAACSGGQEPYSISMIITELASWLKGWKVEIVGTDLTQHVLRKARLGLYSPFEVQRGLSADRLRRHFEQEGESWKIKSDIAARVAFRRLNLLEYFGPLGRFDLIFCRNVLIYFDASRKRDILDRIARSMAADGALVLGATESLVGHKTSFTSDPLHRGFHRRKPE